MFNSPPSQIEFSKEEQLENSLRGFLVAIFKTLQTLEGHEAEMVPILTSIKDTLALIKDKETIRVLIAEAVATCTPNTNDQLALMQKLASALQTLNSIDKAKK